MLKFLFVTGAEFLWLYLARPGPLGSLLYKLNTWSGKNHESNIWMKVIKRGSIDLLQQKITSWQRHCVTSGDVGSSKTEDWYPPPLAPLSHTPLWHIGENSWLHLVSFLSVHFVYIPTSPVLDSRLCFCSWECRSNLPSLILSSPLNGY